MSSPGVTPDEVHNVAFRKPPIGSRGYDEDAVDALLERVEQDLAAGRPVAELVRSARFGKPPLGTRGYNVEEVDAFLDRLAGAPASSAERAPSVVTGSAEQPFVQERGLLSRLFGRR